MSKILKIFALCLSFLSSNVLAILEIEITQGADNAMPIIVSPFNQEDLLKTTKISEVVSNDLKNSGRFNVSNYQISNENINFANLQAQKIEAVVTGKIYPSGYDQYKIVFSLFDTFNQKKLTEKEYQVKSPQLRKLAHHISDIIYQELMGDRGIFSTKIAYVLVNRQGKLGRYSLQVSDSDGYNTHTLLTSRFPIMSPSWSPDGKKISYVSFEGHRAAIYIQEIATGKREIISKFPGINGAPAWSPDGSKLALVLTKTGYPKIYILDLATRQLTQITDGWYLDTEPSWSSDGRSIAFTSNRGGSPQIYRIALADKKITRLTFSGPYNARSSFIPNKEAIVILHREGEMFTIATQELKTGNLTILSPIGLNESPSIAPNGKMVVYATNKSGKGILAESSIDGKVKVLLPALDGEVQEPAWSPFLN